MLPAKRTFRARVSAKLPRKQRELAAGERIVQNSVSERPELRRPLYNGRRNLWSLLNSLAKTDHFAPCPCPRLLPELHSWAPRERSIAMDCCAAQRAELKGGHAKTLAKHGYASARPPEE